MRIPQDTLLPPRLSCADAGDSPCIGQHEMRALLEEADRQPPRLAPPGTKRGAQTTNEGNAGVHWLGLSHPDATGEAFCDLLQTPRAEWRDGDRGMAHYPRCLFMGSIRVGYGGDERNGSHMEVPGRACEEIESAPWFTGWAAFFARAVALGFKATRLDLYKDVRDGSITVGEVDRKWQAGEVSSRAEEATFYERKRKGCRGESGGATLGIGSRKSGTYLRIYDKAKEQGACEPWTRIEVELKDDRAQLVISEIAAKGFKPTTVGSVINGHTEFKAVNAEGKNRYRAPVWEAWRVAMATAEKLRRSMARVPVSVAQAERNLERQYGPTIAMLQAHYGGKTKWVADMAARNFGRIGKRHIEALEQAEEAVKREAMGQWAWA